MSTADSYCVGSPSYLPPEICNGGNYSTKADIWMLGCLLYELIALRPPFKGDTYYEIVMSITSQKAISIPQHANVRHISLLNQMLNKNQNDRPTTADIITNIILASTISSIQISADYNTCRVDPMELFKESMEYYETSLELVKKQFNANIFSSNMPTNEFSTPESSSSKWKNEGTNEKTESMAATLYYSPLVRRKIEFKSEDTEGNEYASSKM